MDFNVTDVSQLAFINIIVYMTHVNEIEGFNGAGPYDCASRFGSHRARHRELKFTFKVFVISGGVDCMKTWHFKAITVR